MPTAYGALGERDTEAGGAQYVALHPAALFEPVQVPSSRRVAWKKHLLAGITSVVAASLLLLVVLQVARSAGSHQPRQHTPGQASVSLAVPQNVLDSARTSRYLLACTATPSPVFASAPTSLILNLGADFNIGDAGEKLRE